MIRRLHLEAALAALLIILPAGAALAESPKIGAVDVQKVLDNSIVGQQATKKLKELGEKYAADLKAAKGKLDALVGEIDKNSLLWNEQTRKEKEDERRRLERDLSRTAKDYDEDFKARQRRVPGDNQPRDPEDGRGDRPGREVPLDLRRPQPGGHLLLARRSNPDRQGHQVVRRQEAVTTIAGPGAPPQPEGTCMPDIHPTAVIQDGAVVADDAVIGPYSVIGPRVTLGPGTVIDHHVSVMGRTTLGSGNRVHPFASIGGPPRT